MTRVPRRHLEEALPISARERAPPLRPAAETEIVAAPDPYYGQPNAGSPASGSEHRAAVMRLARSHRPRPTAKSP